MAALGTTLMAKVLGHSEAEKAFRPWWDILEDFMIYGLVMLGLIVIPTAMIMGTPLDCNFCQADHCGEDFRNNATMTLKNPGFNSWWVKKYCTLNGSVTAFMLYFPYFLLIVALILVLIERVFLKVFKAGIKMEKFYSLLIRQNILTKPGGDGEEIVESGTDCIDGGREAIEVRQSFRRNDNYFASYLIRTMMVIFVATSFLVWMLYRGLPELELQDAINCDVHGYWFECSGQPQQFYLYILYITLVIITLYIGANCFNLLWLIFPCFGKLNRVMNTYRKRLKETNTEGKIEKLLLGDLYHIYFNNRDLRLLLNLLSASSGIAPAIAIIALFDKTFQNATKPTILQINWAEDLGIARVEFQEPKTGVRAALSHTRGVKLMYVAEIVPPADTAVEAFEFKTDGNTKITGSIEMKPLIDVQLQAATFTGLKKDVSYSIKVSTVVNGKTISQVTQDIKEEHQTLPEKLETIVTEDGLEQQRKMEQENKNDMRVEQRGDCIPYIDA